MKNTYVKALREAEGIIGRRLELVNRSRCYTYNPEGGCLYCGNGTFRYHSSAFGKRYYQCEKCRGINH